ncbi:v-type proton ATPase subunit C [Caerostris extrusa]|uniref:V-type proton ATPase subunit C n=1 Tax=Caerostris extrusa TaxID=172846 RepID=A0AAV4QAA0_CAEEX|nr:v-type proton ATPase subunit C [Caerostris extrusa]
MKRIQKRGLKKSASDKGKEAIEEANEQEEFLKKQENLLEHIANVEKEQATFGSLRPCDSCEFVSPFQKTDSWCYNCLCFRRNRKKPNQFWIVSIPGEPSKEEAFRSLNNEATQANNLSINYKFHVPELKIGTLDELIYLAEELRLLDDYTEDALHRLVEFMREVLEGNEHFRDSLKCMTWTFIRM